MDTGLFISRKEAKHVVQAAWRQYRNEEYGTPRYFDMVEFVGLARGQAMDFGVEWEIIQTWEGEIDQELKNHATR